MEELMDQQEYDNLIQRLSACNREDLVNIIMRVMMNVDESGSDRGADIQSQFVVPGYVHSNGRKEQDRTFMVIVQEVKWVLLGYAFNWMCILWNA